MKTLAALPIALLLTLSPAVAGPSAADEASGPVGVARGTFGHPGHEPLAVVDAFAWEAGRSLGEGNAIHVQLSGELLDHAALDGAIDFEMELERQRARAPYAELEIDPRDLTWLGSSFSLPDGWGCAWCRIGRPKARLRLEDGRVRGRLDVETVDGPDDDGFHIALSLDVPIARLEGLIPLPAGGGEPASALELCRASVLSGDREAARALCLSPDDPQLASWKVLLFSRDALRAARLTVRGGSLKGDRALLRIETSDGDERQRGEVFLVRTPSGWRYEAERLTPIWED